MTERRVLVTGGAGFVGSHTCKLLSHSGYLPVTYDDLSNGERTAVRWGPLEIGSLHDHERLTNVVQRYRPSAVLHFAGSIEAGASIHDPVRFYNNNVSASLTLLRVIQDAQISALVFSSTAAVYGNPENTPITENHPLLPVNPYGRSKLVFEQIVADVAAASHLRYASLRYFNAAGADPDGELGENHKPETHLIPLVIQAALGQRSEIVVFGTDYDTPDGTCIRDYVHVTDLATAHGLALHYLLNGGDSFTANLGTGRCFSVFEVITTVSSVTKCSIPIQLAQRRDGDPPRLVADASLAQKTLGWKPAFPDLETQIRHAAAWLTKTEHIPLNNTSSIPPLNKGTTAPSGVTLNPPRILPDPHNTSHSERFGNDFRITKRGSTLP